MNCQDVRDYFPELEGAELPSPIEQEVRSHLALCAECRHALEADAQLREVLRARAPRFEAPPRLRRKVAALLDERRAAPWWRRWQGWTTWLPVGLAATAAGVLLAWFTPGLLRPDPLAGLTAEAVHEHAEYTREAMAQPAPDPTAVLAPLRPRLAFALDPVFRGDAEVRLMAAAASDVGIGRPAAALTYRNAAGVYSTLFLLPEDVPVPAENRLTIQTYKPHHRLAEGRQMLLWKQRGLTYLLVSDLAESDLPAMFLRIRTAS
jgi:anti-sigma factor RsiW